MIKKRYTLKFFCLEWLQKIIIEITTYCDEKKGMFDKNKKRIKMFFKKRLKISPIFFFKNTGLNPKNETKIEGNTLGYYYTLDYSLLLRKKKIFFFQ